MVVPKIQDNILRALTLAILVVLLFSCNINKRKQIDCAALRKGRFFYKGILTGSHYIIDRSESIQTEKNLTKRTISKWKITWVGPCEYKTAFLSMQSLDTLPGEGVRMYTPENTEVVHFRILEVNDHYYIFKGPNGSGGTFTDTMWLPVPKGVDGFKPIRDVPVSN